MRQIFFLCVFIIIGFSYAEAKTSGNPVKPFVVVLDAGHGGHDSGNTGHKGAYRESDICLSIVLKMGATLEKLPNVKVIYTRKTDVFVELRERAAIANRNNADLFVSVHCNAHHSQAHGAETFVLGLHKNQANFEVAKRENEVIYLEENYQEKYAGFDPKSPDSFIGMMLMQEAYLDQSILLASLVQNNIVGNLKRFDRSVKQAGFWVLHNTYMPAVLIETGFLTNSNEGAYLNSVKGQTEMAREIAKAVESYIKSMTAADVIPESSRDAIKEIQIEETIAGTEENLYPGIVFKVQIAASSKKLDPTPSNFKGLKEISREKEGNLYKYYYGETSDYNKIQVLKMAASQKGFDAAFIVAFKGGKKVSLPEVLNSKRN
ncbi:MAG TPA: N-acetylmuramoyl-L-alanine amidase [Flavobacteriaceae bacterium]|nr:N-acetylmuramoyl-L-alanine amidase [Flavobacteriaceae bacterium]